MNSERPCVQYVNDQTIEHCSRNQDADVFRTCFSKRSEVSRSCVNFYDADECAKVRMLRSRVRASSIREGVLQRALYPRQKGASHGRPSTCAETRGHLCNVRGENRHQGWVGALSASLQAGQIRNTKGRSGQGVRFHLRLLWRIVSPFGVRFSSPWGQIAESEQDVPEQLRRGDRYRAFQVHPALRELSSIGAP